MTLLTGISLIVQVKLAAGRLYLDVQLPRMISPSLYFARMLCICGGPPGTSVDRRGEKREKRERVENCPNDFTQVVFFYIRAICSRQLDIVKHISHFAAWRIVSFYHL